MSKRHVVELAEVYSRIFQDAVYAFPALRSEFERDLTRLQVSVKQRGLHVYFVDLPAVCKHLDKCLAGGEYKSSGLPLTKRVSGAIVIPKFLRGLYLLVFDTNGHLKNDASNEAIFFLRQIFSGAKKADFPCGLHATQDSVLDFVKVDLQLPEPERLWGQVSAVISDIHDAYAGWHRSPVYLERIAEVVVPEFRDTTIAFLKCLDKVSLLISTTLGEYNFQDWRFRHGPGAISEVSGPSNKYCWPNWSERLESVFPIADCGFHSFSSWADTASMSVIGSSDPCSRMVAVPKTVKGPRLICAEPVANQWCQQNLWHYFRTRSESSFIGNFVRFSDQSLNQELCQRGSLDGSLSTVDLSSASDRVTCHAVGQFFRGNPRLLLALRATRTRFVQQTITPRVDSLIELRKFSTMGSACTFPIESLIFLGVALASVLTVRNMPVTRRSIDSLIGEVAVFGDDIVIPSDSRSLLFEALKVLHFEVNVTKSFWTGRFRESCGIDSYAGVDVTPAYWRSPNNDSPESVARTVAVRNNFYQKALQQTAAYLASTIHRYSIPYVRFDSGVVGFKTRVGPIVNGHRVRYNCFLHRSETLIPLLIASVKRSPTNDDSALFQYFTECPSPFDKWTHGVSQRPISKVRYGWVHTSEIV